MCVSQKIILFLGLTLAISSCDSGTSIDHSEMMKVMDSDSGFEVWQMTDDKGASMACYFEGQAFTSDAKFIVVSSKRTGKWKLNRISLKDGSIKVLTELERDIYKDEYTVMPDGRRVCYIDGWKLLASDIIDGGEEVLFDFTDRLVSQPKFAGSFTNDGIYTVVWIETDSLDEIYRINLETQELLTVHSSKEGRITHPQLNPMDPELITYVPGPDTQNDMTLPMEDRARTWIIDLRAGTDSQFVTAPYGYRATHESWQKDGERFFFFRKSRPGWIPAAICSIAKDGSDLKIHYQSDSIYLGHGLASPDGEWFLADSQDPSDNELMLINIESGEGKMICKPDATIEDEDGETTCHVHPSFSSDGEFVIYTSDKTGVAQVYVVPIQEIKKTFINQGKE